MIGFGYVGGIVAGFVANQPVALTGVLDIDASDKASLFIRTCNVYNIPLVTLVDVPGFLPGVAQEHSGIIRHGAKMLFACSSATVPKTTVILRKAYGGSYLAMCSKDPGADLVLAWPTAEVAVMGPEAASRVVHRRDLAAAGPAAPMAELTAAYREHHANPFRAAESLQVDDVIPPASTRRNGSGAHHAGAASPPKGAAPEAAIAPNTVLAQIAGTVQKIFAERGRHAEVKAPMVLLDATKMDMYVYSPRAETIDEVGVKVGDAVQVGECLLRYALEE